MIAVGNPSALPVGFGQNCFHFAQLVNSYVKDSPGKSTKCKSMGQVEFKRNFRNQMVLLSYQLNKETNPRHL